MHIHLLKIHQLQSSKVPKFQRVWGGGAIPSWSEQPKRRRRAWALAGTRVILRWPYRLETTLDLGVLVLVARCDASHEKASTASLPQAPYDSTTRGMHVHPSSEHFTWLAEFFLSSVATAAAPAADRGKG